MTTTLTDMFREGRGVLVLDRYAEASAVASRPVPGIQRFLAMALTAPGLDEAISTVLLTFDGLLSTAQLRRARGTRANVLAGVCLEVATVDDAVLNQVREAGARTVELRSNLGPGRSQTGQPATDAPALARVARAAQDAGLVPVLTFAMPDLGTQSLRVTYAATANALRALIAECEANGVDLAELIVRTNMVVPGLRAPDVTDPHEVGRATASVLAETLPALLGGVLLLSGGMDERRACANLAAVMSEVSRQDLPWPLTFAFSRPLIESAVRLWDGTAGSPVASMAVTSACRSAANALNVGVVG